MHIQVKSKEIPDSKALPLLYPFFNAFSDGKSNMTQIRLSMIKEVAHGIKGFFDAFVGTQLLYNNERVS